MEKQGMENIKILFIEDDKVDQMAFKRFVKDENLSYNYTIAGSVSEAKRILDSEKFDIVIIDYHLGDGTAFDIFDLIKDTPVIITTGTGDEGIAVKAMKGGAYDYLIKDPERNYLKVLPITVENAIKHKKSEKQFRMLSHAIMSIDDSVYITDMDDRIIFVNEAFCRTYGYEEEDILGRHSDVLWKEASTDDDVINVFPIIIEGGWKDEFYHRRKDGSEFPVFLSRLVIKDKNGNEVAVVGVARDITEHKRAEETLRESF
ncbi:MAG TPA: PAS domain S-box protein, partial [Bacteroidia bacterium]|nr:PAS domain S-box protein [Bacteroidia bacterium]